MAGKAVDSGTQQLVAYTRREIFQAVIAGVVVGAVVWMMTWLLDKAIFEPLMCRVANAAQCYNHLEYSGIAAQVVGAITGLVMLVRQLSYRPLLVVIAVTVALWSMVRLAYEWPWYASLPVMIVLYGLAYGLFVLLARFRHLVMSVVAIVVMVVIVRLAVNS